jgi:hypothetical protein
MSDPFWNKTGIETTHANMAMVLRPMAAEAAISDGVILFFVPK